MRQSAEKAQIQEGGRDFSGQQSQLVATDSGPGDSQQDKNNPESQGSRVFSQMKACLPETADDAGQGAVYVEEGA